MEKKNDDLRRYFHRKINRWDTANNLLLVEKRQEALQGQQRTKRPYEKNNLSFWQEGGKQDAARKVLRVSTQLPEATQGPVLPDTRMTEETLKTKKVSELLSLLLEKTGRTLNKKTRKQEVIKALLNLETRTE